MRRSGRWPPAHRLTLNRCLAPHHLAFEQFVEAIALPVQMLALASMCSSSAHSIASSIVEYPFAKRAGPAAMTAIANLH